MLSWPHIKGSFSWLTTLLSHVKLDLFSCNKHKKGKSFIWGACLVGKCRHSECYRNRCMNSLIFYLLLLNISQILGSTLWDYTLRPEELKAAHWAIHVRKGVIHCHWLFWTVRSKVLFGGHWQRVNDACAAGCFLEGAKALILNNKILIRLYLYFG